MQKEKVYENVRFRAEALNEAYDKLFEFAALKGTCINCGILEVAHDDSTWTYDNKDEFFSDYRKFKNSADFKFWEHDTGIYISVYSSYTVVKVESKDRSFIHNVFEIFEKSYPLDYDKNLESGNDFTVFIGHGGSNHWRDLKDHLQDKHNIKIEAYETGARAGHTIRGILEEMANKSTFALLVMTAEDEQDTGQMRARQNVIHEIGLFQGKLGFNRAIVLMENSTEEFSNIAGVQQIRYSKISETFGEVLATIKREFN